VLGPNSSTPRRVDSADRAKRAFEEPKTATECPPPLGVGEEGIEGPVGPGVAGGIGTGPLGPRGCTGLIGTDGAHEVWVLTAADESVRLRAT
jgi:hypothetical protein